MDHQEAPDEPFAEGLAVLSAEGVTTLERVMDDGTKVKPADVRFIGRRVVGDRYEQAWSRALAQTIRIQ